MQIVTQPVASSWRPLHSVIGSVLSDIEKELKDCEAESTRRKRDERRPQ